MKLKVVDGEYQVTWYSHHDRFSEARKWCISQFGDNWGTAQSEDYDRVLGSLHTLTFKRLYHAQWFMLRWAE